MDGNRFDAFARAVSSPAGATRRRSLLRSFAAGAMAGIAGGAARETTAAPAPVVCAMALTATIRSGPSAGLTLAGGKPGELTGSSSVAIGADGAIDQGTLQLPDGTTLPLVGQATGRDLSLRARVGLGQTLALLGVADQPVAQCAGAVDGLLTGPQPGDLGDWHATMAGATGGASTAGAPPTAAAPAAPTVAAGSSSPTPTATVTGSVTPTAPAGTTPSPTAAPTSEPTAAPTTAPTAAPTAEPTMAPTAVSCPSGTTLCGDACLDLATDVNNCGACGHVCPDAQPGFVAACAAGNCFFERAPAPPCDSGLTRCAAGCVNL
ncbi:MAG TPA: hypothetical protein VFQ80_05035, partial [Thermomicrobiales bacterium]|nr:hypothetical protein [Thermomicrobiales bacterium]